jgi:hypothetical protein
MPVPRGGVGEFLLDVAFGPPLAIARGAMSAVAALPLRVR